MKKTYIFLLAFVVTFINIYCISNQNWPVKDSQGNDAGYYSKFYGDKQIGSPFFHTGVDIGVIPLNPSEKFYVYPVRPGTIAAVRIDSSDPYHNYVLIKINDNTYDAYGHINPSITDAQVGNPVTCNDPLGDIVYYYGPNPQINHIHPHLHFHIHRLI